MKASGTVGASVAVEAGGKQDPSKIEISDYLKELGTRLSDNPKKEQARYIAKSAEKRAEIYDGLSRCF